MYIKNTSSKIISIGTTVLMPDTTMVTDIETTRLPAIAALIQKGFVVIEEGKNELNKPAQHQIRAADASSDNKESCGSEDIERDKEMPKSTGDETGLSETLKDGVAKKRSKKNSSTSETNPDENLGE